MIEVVYTAYMFYVFYSKLNIVSCLFKQAISTTASLDTYTLRMLSNHSNSVVASYMFVLNSHNAMYRFTHSLKA